MAYKRKTKDIYELQGNYGYGWDRETSSESYSEIKRDYKDYKNNVKNGSFRIVKKRIYKRK